MKNSNKKCIICGSRCFTKRFSTHDRMFSIPKNFFYISCKSCGLIQIDPLPAKNELSLHYPGVKYLPHANNDKSGKVGRLRVFLLRHYYDGSVKSKILRFLVPQSFAMPTVNKKGRILDVGCGTGDALVVFKKLGWQVYGKEISKVAVAIARKRGLKNVTVGTDRDAKKYPDEYFDVIRLYHVIEHIDNPALTVKILAKKLKPDGEILIATPNSESPVSKVFGKYWGQIDAPRHLYLFNIRTLSLLTQKNGLKVTRLEFSSAMNISGSLQYFIEDLMHRKLKKLAYLWIIFYPIEWILDRLHLGDSFVITVRKINT